MVPVKCIRHIMSCVRPEKGSCSFYSKKSDSTEYNIIPYASRYSNHTSGDKARILTDYFLHSISIEYPVITVTTVCVFTFAVNDIGICFMLNLFADALIYKLALVYTSAELLVLVTLTSWITRESTGTRWLNRSCTIAFDVLVMALYV